jgi:hypothetical protein
VPIKFILVHPTVESAAAALPRLGDEGLPGAGAATMPPRPSGAFASHGSLRIDHRPLAALIAAGEMARVDAAALTYLPSTVPARMGVRAEDIVHDWCGDRPQVVCVHDTPLGRLATVLLPRFETQLYTDPGDIVRVTHAAIDTAAAIGASTVVLTGQLASATAYGRALMRAAGGGTGPAISTGHATTTAAVLLATARALAVAGRDLAQEHVSFLGLGSIGAAVLRLMLRCLPHPAALTLCDVYSQHDRLVALARELEDAFAFRGALRVCDARTAVPAEVYDARVIIGATNVPDVLDLGRVQPGTIIIDDSAPHCFAVAEAMRRFERDADLLFTEGGVVHFSEPLARTIYLPSALPPPHNGVLELFNLALDARALPACMLSGLLAARFPELPPTVGLIEPDTGLRHRAALDALGFEAGPLHCGHYVLPEALLARFRARFGTVANTPHRPRLGERAISQAPGKGYPWSA